MNTIETFKGGKYSDEIRQVYYEMLSGNISVGKCGDLLRKIFKMANIDIERVPGKSLSAEMLAEMEILSKVHVHEEVMKGSTNILHTDGTKYKFNEIGRFQVSTGSGSFTLGTEQVPSGETDTYFNTFKHSLEDMSSLVVPEDQVDDSIKKILILKGLIEPS